MRALFPIPERRVITHLTTFTHTAPRLAAMPAPLTLADAWLTRLPRTLTRDTAAVLTASLVIAMCARVVIPLPSTPVPITGQTFAVLLTGILLGARRGSLACVAYLAEGACGLPVFAGGIGGWLPFIGPTAGYLLAFPIAAYVTGLLAERGMDRKPGTALVAMLLGSLIILFLGALRLSVLLGGAAPGFALGFAPFLIGDLVKAGAAATVLPLAWRITKR